MIMIETPRLILRRFRADDLDKLCLLYADPEVRRFFPEGTLNRAQTKEELDWHLNGHLPRTSRARDLGNDPPRHGALHRTLRLHSLGDRRPIGDRDCVSARQGVLGTRSRSRGCRRARPARSDTAGVAAPDRVDRPREHRVHPDGRRSHDHAVAAARPSAEPDGHVPVAREPTIGDPKGSVSTLCR